MGGRVAKSNEDAGLGLVQASAEQLRDMIFRAEPGERIGSLRSIADALGVGIVTVQQAARVLEHEGLLDVRRGPGGGYYGKRPDARSLERSLDAYLRTQPASWQEVLDLTSLLFNELAAAAAMCTDPELQANLRGVLSIIDRCEDEAMIGQLEKEFQDALFLMVDRPLFNLLTQMALRFSEGRSGDPIYQGLFGVETWSDGRRRIIAAILDNDPELARFEANRNNRVVIQRAIAQERSAGDG
jgi:GntR family transcriptional regulator, transcriptional repressor for pyruvate dehydrogenase complex